MSEANMDELDNRGDENAVVRAVEWALIAVRSSFIGFVVFVGLVFLTISVLTSTYVLSSVDYGIISGMTFIWGMSAFLYAVLGKLVLRLIGYS